MISFLLNDPRQLPMLPALAQIFDGCRLVVGGGEVSSKYGFWDFNNRGTDKSDYPWSSIDARIVALAVVGIHKPWLSLVGVPPHGTANDTALYSGDAVRHTVDVRETAQPITDETPYGLAVDQPWFKKPTRIRSRFCYEFARRAVERYIVAPIKRKEEPVIAGILPWNEPDDGQSYPPMAEESLGNFELAWQWYREDIYLPMLAGATDAMAGVAGYCPVGGPETAYVSGLETQLAWEGTLGSHVHVPITFHNWAQDGGKDTGTLANWITLLDRKMAIVERYRNGRTVMVTEMGDRGAGWILYALDHGMRTYPQITNWVAYPSIDDGEQIVDHETHQLTSYGEKWKRAMAEQRRRAVKS